MISYYLLLLKQLIHKHLYNKCLSEQGHSFLACLPIFEFLDKTSNC